MLERVISGGQSGADQAGWRAARTANIPTGGFMPRGFLTEDGPRPEFAEMYGAREHVFREYPPRTQANVNWCDYLIWFGDTRTPGGRLTLSLCDDLAITTPRLVVTRPGICNFMPDDAASYVHSGLSGTPGILLIAGNRESKAPGIGEWVERYLTEVFRILKERDCPTTRGDPSC